MKTVVLIDPCTGGHHEWFLQLFAEELIALGWRVAVIAPGAGTVAAALPAGMTVVVHEWRPDVSVGVAGRRRLWREAYAAVVALEGELGAPVDLVFFAWLDAFLGHGFSRYWIDRCFPREWSGLVFQPWMFRVPMRARWLRHLWLDPLEPLHSRRCRWLATLDEAVTGPLARVVGRPVIPFPDVADDSSANTSLAGELQRLAAGRSVVLLTGVVDRRKGLGRFFAAAREANATDWLFVVAGPVAWDGLPAAEAEELRRWIASPPEQGHILVQRSLSEGEVNALVRAAAAVWLSYENFPFSSNLLSKCARFCVPAVGNGRFLIGERMRAFSLGIEIPERGEAAWFASAGARGALRQFAAAPEFRAGCARYSNAHSREALRAALATGLGIPMPN